MRPLYGPARLQGTVFASICDSPALVGEGWGGGDCLGLIGASPLAWHPPPKSSPACLLLQKSDHMVALEVMLMCITCNITTPAICPEFVQKRIENVLFVNYPNKVWNRATFLTEYCLVSIWKAFVLCLECILNISNYCLKSIKIVSGLNYHIFSLHLALHYYT